MKVGSVARRYSVEYSLWRAATRVSGGYLCV